MMGSVKSTVLVLGCWVVAACAASQGMSRPMTAFSSPFAPRMPLVHNAMASRARPTIPSLLRSPLRHGVRSTKAVVEGAEHFAFLASAVDPHAFSQVDISGLAHQLHDAFIHLADAAGDAAAVVPEEKKDDGFFELLVKGVKACLNLLHTGFQAAGVPGAWGLAIMTFTIFVKGVTYPLNYKQMASTMAMQKLSPKLKAIQARYKDDPPKMNEKFAVTAQLYKDEQVNPLAGCIPSLIQLPIFISLYRGLLELAEDDKLQESGPVGEYNPVTNLPVDSLGWLTKGWVDGHPALGWGATLAYLSLPVILVVTQSVSQKLLQPPASDDPAQQQTQAILKFLPLMIGWFALNVPAGLGVYWVINNGLSTLQQWYIRQQFKDVAPAGASGGSMSFQDEVRSTGTVTRQEPPKFKAVPTKAPKVEAPKEEVVAKDAEASEASEDDDEGDDDESKTAAKKKAKAKDKSKKKKGSA